MLTDYLFCHLQEMLKEIDHRDSYSHYYVPNVEIKYLNVLIDGKRFFDFPVKMKKKLTGKLLR